MTDTPNRPITRATAALMLGVSTRTLARYLADGRLTRYEDGLGRVRIDEDEVVRLLSPQRVPAQRSGS
jgi:excisionase family DNA binding protein